MSNLNWVDYVILIIFFFSALAGFGRGLVREIISLLTLVAAFFVASMFASTLAAVFTNNPSVQNAVSQASTSIGVSASQPVSYVALGISFALIFAGTIIVGSIFGFLINMAFQTGILGIGNRILGGVFGLARGFIINLVLIFVVQLSPLASQPWWQQSQFVAAYQPAVQWLANIVSPSLANIKERFGQTLQDVNAQFQNTVNSVGGLIQ